ncbi:hypothetical protein A2U01_0074353, partial [Trifolium medium]|nr:hypothetical protein [Trifolium medium]
GSLGMRLSCNKDSDIVKSFMGCEGIVRTLRLEGEPV